MTLKLYAELAAWWPLLSPPDDYLEETDFFHRALAAAGLPPAPTLLELGCGGGNNAVHLKARFARVTLTDLSPQMLAVSRALNPDCEHLVGDMRTLRLGRAFDVVFVHDAIDYMTTRRDLRLALETAFIHCAPGGLALVAPDHVRETFRPATDHGGGDGDARALRYLEWTYDPDDADTTYTVDYAYLLRENDRPVWIEHDRHICGLFPRAEWVRLLREVGFRPEIIHDQYGRDIFLARRPTQDTVWTNKALRLDTQTRLGLEEPLFDRSQAGIFLRRRSYRWHKRRLPSPPSPLKRWEDLCAPAGYSLSHRGLPLALSWRPFIASLMSSEILSSAFAWSSRACTSSS